MGGSSQKAQAGYQPTWQSGADQNYQSTVQSATPWAQSLPSQIIPGLNTAANNVVNNPYNQQALDGASQVAQMGQQYNGNLNTYGNNLAALGNANGVLNAQQQQGLESLIGQSGAAGYSAAGYGANAAAVGRALNQDSKQAWGETQGMIPATTGGAQYADPALYGAANLANLTSSTALAGIPGLTGGMDAATQVLNNGFDPQRQLYNRNYQQMLDQQNAINSMNGLSGGYAAGLTGQTANNFNLDWQNAQLGRQVQALGAYGTEQGVVANNLTNLLGSAANNYANLSNAGVNQYNSLTSTAANNLDNLVSTGMNARAQGAAALQNGQQIAMQGQMDNLAALAQQGALQSSMVNNTANLNTNTAAMYDNSSQAYQAAQNMLLASSQAPQLTYQNQQQANLAALTSAAQGAGYALAPDQALAGMDSDYMKLGQGATQNQQNAAKINNAQSNAESAGIGKLVGTVASIALAPATGGLSLFALGPSAAGG